MLMLDREQSDINFIEVKDESIIFGLRIEKDYSAMGSTPCSSPS
jgi:hypothetical protein